MDFYIFSTTFSLIFLAELGDKTQVTAMALAGKYTWKEVLIGVSAAFAVLNLAAVVIGKFIFLYLPLPWIKIISGSLFVILGLMALLSNSEEEEKDNGKFDFKYPVATSFFMILFAELGDKTQIATSSLAAQHTSPVTVFAASTLALMTVSCMGIIVGKRISGYINPASLQKLSGILFLIFGAATLYSL